MVCETESIVSEERPPSPSRPEGEQIQLHNPIIYKLKVTRKKIKSILESPVSFLFFSFFLNLLLFFCISKKYIE